VSDKRFDVRSDTGETDGSTIDNSGNILDPVNSELFRIGLSQLIDASSTQTAD